MLRRTFLALAATASAALAPLRGLAQSDADTVSSTPEGDEMIATAVETGYAPVNGLQMYYEIHGEGEPLLLLHGAYMTIASMSRLLEALPQTRQVIAVEFQGHGHTADVDRPIAYDQLTEDAAAVLDYLGVETADVVGYSMGGGVALRLAMRHPDLVRKVVAASASYRLDGMYPEVLAGIAGITPEVFMGMPWYEEHARVAPHPEDFSTLVEKLKQLDAVEFGWPKEEVQAIAAPTMLAYGDADVFRLEHMVELFRLLGGGVPGDLTGLPRARLAILPGTTHLTMMTRADWLVPMIAEFLAEPMPASAP